MQTACTNMAALLTVSGREAGHTLELKNKLLKELQDKLVPLEKERDTQTQGKLEIMDLI